MRTCRLCGSGSAGQEGDLPRSKKTDTLTGDAQASIHIQETIPERILPTWKASNEAGQIELMWLERQCELTAMGMAGQGEINTEIGGHGKNVGAMRQQNGGFVARNACSETGEGRVRIKSAGPILSAVIQTDEMECCAGNGKMSDLVPQKRNMRIMLQASFNRMRSCIVVMVPKAGKDPVSRVECVQVRKEVWNMRRIGVQNIAG